MNHCSFCGQAKASLFEVSGVSICGECVADAQEDLKQMTVDRALSKLVRAEIYDEEVDVIESRIQELERGLAEAMSWNWLDEDYPPAIAEQLRRIAGLSL